MRKASRIIIRQDETVEDALKQLERSQERLLVCVDENRKLKGVINDGDIRRALLKGATLMSSIKPYIQKKFSYVTEQCGMNDAMKYMSNRVNVLPVLDHNDCVVGFYSLKDKEEFSDIKLKKVTILGMGYVGLTLAVALSDVGFAVNGYDVDEDLLGALRAGKSRFYEKGLEKYLDNVVGKGITFDSHLENVKGNVYIITVGTPIIKSTMKPNIKYAMKAAADIAQILDKGDLVILRSTVPVGFCRDIIPILEKGSKLKVGRDFYLAYAPERTTEGQALKELRSNPQIIGGYDEKSKELAARLFNSLTHSVIDVESLEAAEMCKLIDNTYRDHIFAFANQLAPLAEKIGVDLCRLIDAVNHGYSRNSVPRPSPGVGGACLSKDPYILGEVFRKHRLNPSLVLGARKVNEKGPILVRNKLKKLLSSVGKDIKKARILLVGLAFKGKPETSDLRDSTSVWFLDCLPSKTNVCAYDPIVPKREIEKLGIEAVSIEEGFKGADAVVFLNNHASYVDLNVFELAKTMHRPAVFIDTWHLFEPSDIKQIKGIKYGGLGNV